jgi:hypothetical protein
MALPGWVRPEFWRRATSSGLKQCGESLVAVTRAHRDTLAASGAATAQYRCSALCFHAGAEAVRLHAAMAVGLECALGHWKCAPVSLSKIFAKTASLTGKPDGKSQVYRRLRLRATTNHPLLDSASV